jgi:hypothetical protein
MRRRSLPLAVSLSLTGLHVLERRSCTTVALILEREADAGLTKCECRCRQPANHICARHILAFGDYIRAVHWTADCAGAGRPQNGGIIMKNIMSAGMAGAALLLVAGPGYAGSMERAAFFTERLRPDRISADQLEIIGYKGQATCRRGTEAERQLYGRLRCLRSFCPSLRAGA